MIMNLRIDGNGHPHGLRELYEGVNIHFDEWDDGRKTIFITHDRDTIMTYLKDSYTEDGERINGVSVTSAYRAPLGCINGKALRYEIDGDNLILYYSIDKIKQVLKKQGIVFSKILK